MSDLAGLLLLPLLTAALVYLVPGRRWVGGVAAGGSLVTLGIGLAVAARVYERGPWQGGFFYVDALGAFLVGCIVIVAALAAVYSIGYFDRLLTEGTLSLSRWRSYHFWFQVFVATMLLVVTVANLGVMWAAMEATTLASAFLVGFSGSQGGLEASWKYLVICTVGITLALFGVILTYYASFHLHGPGVPSLDWLTLRGEAGELNPGLLRLGFIFILVGFGTKVGLAPMHTWLPDAHSQAPSPVSALLSGVLLPTALYGVLRFHLLLVKDLGPAYSSHLLLIFGLVSMGVAVPFILLQGDLKRLLAYSSLEHMGIITFAVGLESRLAFYGAALQILAHALTKSLLFLCTGNIMRKFGTQKLRKLSGVVGALPWTGPLFLLLVLGLAGMPPFGLFLSELTILRAGLASGDAVWATFIFIGLLAAIFAGLLYYAGQIAFGKTSGVVGVGEPVPWFPYLSLPPFLALLYLGLGIPGPLTIGLSKVAAVLGGVAP